MRSTTNNTTVTRLVMVLVICLLSLGVYYVHSLSNNSGMQQSFNSAEQRFEESGDAQ